MTATNEENIAFHLSSFSFWAVIRQQQTSNANLSQFGDNLIMQCWNAVRNELRFRPTNQTECENSLRNNQQIQNKYSAHGLYCTVYCNIVKTGWCIEQNIWMILMKSAYCCLFKTQKRCSSVSVFRPSQCHKTYTVTAYC